MKTFLLEKYLPVAAIAMGAILFSPPVFPATPGSLMDMMDQFDKLDKQDFQAAIDKANACTRARNFPCSASELAKAEKAANSGQDKKTLLAGQKNLANEKQQLANEIRRAEEERQAQFRRDEEEKQARVRREEERQARFEMEERQAKEAEDRQSTRDYNAAIGAQIRQGIAENAALLGRIDRQTAAAVADSNRIRAAQAAERDRAASERDSRDAERRRDATRDKEKREQADVTRVASAQSAERARESERAAAKERTERVAAEQEQARQKLANEQKAQAAKAEEARQKLAAENAEKTAEQQKKKDYFTAMQRGVRLTASKCMGGAGHYYVSGSMPKSRPKGDYCIDVHYEASCPGDRNVISGVAKNFIGMGGCLGDTYQIDPKPACDVKNVQIRVVDVRPGCG